MARFSWILATVIAAPLSIFLRSLRPGGVEPEEERDVVERHGCDEVQGFLYGRPGPVEVATLPLREAAAGPRRISSSGAGGPQPVSG